MFLLRLEPALREHLQACARDQGVSMNQLASAIMAGAMGFSLVPNTGTIPTIPYEAGTLKQRSKTTLLRMPKALLQQIKEAAEQRDVFVDGLINAMLIQGTAYKPPKKKPAKTK